METTWKCRPTHHSTGRCAIKRRIAGEFKLRTIAFPMPKFPIKGTSAAHANVRTTTFAGDSKHASNKLKAEISAIDLSATGELMRGLQRLLSHAKTHNIRRKVPIAVADLNRIAESGSLPHETQTQAAADAIALQSIFDGRLLQILKAQPELTRALPGKIFEELVAEILAFLGFSDISLRVMTDLGEIDILGFTKDHFGSRVAYLFELKQFGQSGRPVELREITRLYGLRESLRQRLGLTQGAFVTTTSYTSAATEAGEIHGLSLKNYDHLVDWLSEYEIKPNGLYLRSQSAS